MDWQSYERSQEVIEIGDRFISYFDSGGDLPVILFIHGIPTWGYLWWDVASHFQQTHRIVIPDLIGFGHSDKSDRFDRSIRSQEEMLIQLMDHLNIRSFTVVGHDIGGGVAQRIVTFHNDRVERLCLMNSICYDSWPVEMMLQFGHPSVVNKLSATVAIESLKQGLKMGFNKTPDKDFLEGLLTPYKTEVGKRSLVRCAAALNTNHTTELTPYLPTINTPSLILWGEDDSFQPLNYGLRLANDLPNSHFEAISDAKHFVMIDQPSRIKTHLEKFLQPSNHVEIESHRHRGPEEPQHQA